MNREFANSNLQKQSDEFIEDYRIRINPELMTRLVRAAVPVLQQTQWKITQVGLGFAETFLPLNEETTNQHGTHQAALISLSADYTGGMALTSVLTGVPLTGIHKCKPEEAASLWLAAMHVKYVSPSTGHLIGRCQIDANTVEKIRKRYSLGKRVLTTLAMDFTSNGQKVAEAELKYFVQPTIQLLSSSGNSSPLFAQKIKASARMIAGVRATTSETKIRLDSPHDAIAAGPHGEILAKRLKKALPQLSQMVQARTKHIDDVVNKSPEFQQIVLLGAGLDMRPFRLASHCKTITNYEIDLPEMLKERERVIALLPSTTLQSAPKRFAVEADFLKDNVAEKLLEQTSFDPNAPTLIIYEGCSMYFSEQENQAILRNIVQLPKHPKSRVWCDLVTASAVNGRSERPEITQFLKQMDNLGEAFIFGSDEPDQFFRSIGCGQSNTETCRSYFDMEDPIYDVYQFCLGSLGDCLEPS